MEEMSEGEGEARGGEKGTMQSETKSDRSLVMTIKPQVIV